MSQIHPVTIDLPLLSQITGGTAKRPTPITDAVNRARRTASDAVNRVNAGNTLRDKCGLPDPDGSSSHVVGRTAAGEPYEITRNSPYADCVASPR